MRYLDFKTKKEFRKFLRDNNLTEQMYFEKYEPKYDLFTNQKLAFTNTTRYFDEDFAAKMHMAKWLMDQYADVRNKYIVSKLKAKAKEKEWRYAPSQVECRSLKTVPALVKLDGQSHACMCHAGPRQSVPRGLERRTSR